MKNRIPEKIIQEYKVFRDRNVAFAYQRLCQLRNSNKNLQGEKHNG